MLITIVAVLACTFSVYIDFSFVHKGTSYYCPSLACSFSINLIIYISLKGTSLIYIVVVLACSFSTFIQFHFLLKGTSHVPVHLNRVGLYL